MTAPGWYQADGDPAGTTRYWDGVQWIGEPVPTPPAQNPAGGYSAGAMSPGLQGRQLASPGARIGARVIDVLLLGVLAVIVMLPVIRDVINDIDALGPSPSQSAIETVINNALEDNLGRLGIIGIVGLLWDFLWVALVGATPGKLMVGLRVARADNGQSPPGIGKAALRALNRVFALIPAVGGLIGLLVGLVSLIMLFADNQHRTVMDRIASTVVIKK